MKPEELMKRVEFTDIKTIPSDDKHLIMQAVLCFKAKTKGGRWLDNLCVVSNIHFLPGEEGKGRLISVKKDTARMSMFDFITRRTGVRGHKGRFVFVDFEPLD